MVNCWERTEALYEAHIIKVVIFFKINPFRPSLFYSQAQKYLNISGKVFYQNKAKHHLSRISWGMRTYWSSRKRFVLIQVLKSPHHHCLIFMKYIIDIYTNIEMRGSVTVRPPWLLIQIKGWNVSKTNKANKAFKRFETSDSNSEISRRRIRADLPKI